MENQFKSVKLTVNYRNPNTRRSQNGYCAYLRNPERHTNTAQSYAGIGDTPTEAAEACCYWANQAPWVKIVPINKAPRWAVDEAESNQ